MTQIPPLMVVGAQTVTRALEGRRPDCVDVVRRAYLTHADGDSALPHSTFLRRPADQANRIIALPAYLGGDFQISGLKWISSFPGNVAAGLPRASAIVILNDRDTGFPMACFEGSVISAARTAASGVLAAHALTSRTDDHRLGIIGAGLIAQTMIRFFAELDWGFTGARIHDLDHGRAETLARQVSTSGVPDVAVAEDPRDVFAACDIIVIATVAKEPHLIDETMLRPGHVLLHLSLRDLSPSIILTSQNITDDVDHAVREQTSLHLTETATGNRDFIDGTIADVLRGRVVPSPTKPIVYSPFGLGVLDIALAHWLYGIVRDSPDHVDMPDFHQTS